MTKFITYFNLCPIQDTQEFLGIAPDKDERNIITSLGKNMIIIINISTQKQIRSWTVAEKLSAKVVYDHYTQKYVGVFDNYQLRCWDENVNDINKCKKLKFNRSIADLITEGDNTFVLYSDGACEELSIAIKLRKSDNLAATTIKTTNELKLGNIYNLSDIKISKTSSGRRILTYFRRNNENGDIDLIYLPLTVDDDVAYEAKSFRIKRDITETKLVGYAVIDGDKAPVLMSIWSDKRVFLLNLYDDLKPEQAPGNFVSMLSVLDVDTPISILGISRNFVAIYGAVTGLKGASILLYNTQFKVIKAKQYFKTYFNFVKLWSVDSSIIIAMGQNLNMVTYRTSKELLTDLVGTQINNDFQTLIDQGDNINEEDHLEYGLQFSDEWTPKENLNFVDTFKTMIFKMADGKHIPFESSENFERTLNELARLDLHVDVIETDAALENDVVLMTNYNDDGFSTPEVQLIVSQLEKCGASEHEITEKLLLALMKADLLQDIAICLRRYTNISEKVLAKTLGFLLSKYTPDKSKETTPTTPTTTSTETNGDSLSMDVDINDDVVALEKNDNEIENEDYPNVDILAEAHKCIPTICDVQDVLNLALAHTFDIKEICAYIRKEIDFTKILLLFEYLYKLISSSEETFEELPMNMNIKNSFEFEMQILRWFTTLIDAHFTQLALSKDVELVNLLYKWHLIISDYRKEANELESTVALLYNILRNQDLPKNKNYSEWYSIEEVKLF